MDARIRQLQVTISGAAEPDRGTWFARQVLARFCEIFEDRYPGQDISIGRVDLRCTLSAGQLTDPAEVLRCARELAASIDEGLCTWSLDAPVLADEDTPQSARSTSDPLTDPVDPGPWRAAAPAVVAETGSLASSRRDRDRDRDRDRRLVAEDSATSLPDVPDRDDDVSGDMATVEWLIACLRAGTVEAWLDRSAILDGKVTTLPAPQRRPLMIAALSHLHMAGEMFDLLRRMPPATLAMLLKTLDLRQSPPALHSPGMPEGFAVPDADASRPFSPTHPAEGQAARFAAQLLQIPATLPPNSAAVAAFILTQLEQGAVGSPASSPTIEAAGRETAPRQAEAPRLDNAREDESSPDTEFAIPTGFGGLFYLLALVLELGIGETLWKACLPEGRILANVAGCILGEEAAGDAAVSLFGGVTRADAAACPAVSQAQQQVVCEEMLAGLVAAFHRTDVGRLPAPMLDVAASPHGRMLVASFGFPAAIFAWPAPDAASVTAGIETFLRHWPPDAEAPMARGALPDFDRSGRLRRGSALPWAAPLLPACVIDTAATAVMSQVCGGVLSLLHARLIAHGVADVADLAGLVARYLSVPGRILLAPEVMTIVLPMDRIDLTLRAAGLDRDPGWVPWLQRTVRIEFEPVGPDDVL